MTTLPDQNSKDVSPNWQVEVFFDGDCPLCDKEIKLLRWMDRKDKVRFTDIASPTFRPETLGKTMDELMAEIHGRLPDGTFIIGVEVFRRIYAAIGLKLLVWPTRLPGIRHGLDFAYRIFAKNRLRFTGRCHEQSCQVPSKDSSA